jgi:hypothetical protein
MKEDFCLKRIPGAAGRIDSFDGKAVEEVCSGWFDGATLLKFFKEIGKRHEEISKKSEVDVKVSFWKMTEKNPNRGNGVGALVCVQVDNMTYAICPIRKVE